MSFKFILLIFVFSAIVACVLSSENSNGFNDIYVSADLKNRLSSIFSVLPLDMPPTGNEECDEHFRIYKDNFENFEQWAMHMMDANSKLMDGNLDGNVVSLGNYEECLRAQTPEHLFDGKYCLAFLSLAANSSIYDYLRYMRFGNGKSQYFVTENVLLFGPEMAMCIPSSCSAENLQNGMNAKMREQNLTTVIFLDDRACVTKVDDSFDTSDWVAIGVLCFFAALVVASTYYDITHQSKEYRQTLFISFSVYTNSKKLFSLKCESYLHCLHGIRFITSIWILAGHVYATVLSQSSAAVRLLMDLSTFSKVFISNSYPSVDTFLLLSGLLLCFSFLKGVERIKRIRDFNLPIFYFVRYVRLTPVLAFLILISATIMKRVGSGPMWDRGMYASTLLCKETWWIPLLYIQNYLSRPSCIMQSWYLAVDTQLYVLSPIVLILLWKKPKLGIWFLILSAIAGVILIFSISFIHDEHLPFIEMAREVGQIKSIYQSGMESIFQNNRLFIKTHTRYMPWTIGILLGYILYKNEYKTIHISKIYVAAGWICAIFLLFSSICFAYPLMQLQYEYNVWEMSTYLSVHRLTWSIGVAWVIFACVSGHGGIVNWFLSFSFWLPFSRLVYCMYLVHVTVLQTISFSLRESQITTDYSVFIKIVTLFMASTVASVVVSLVFESPFIHIINVLFKGEKKEKNKSLEAPQYRKNESNA